jgi:hypothetical protein
MKAARSGLMVSGATIISALSFTSSPIRPVHSFLPEPVTVKKTTKINQYQHKIFNYFTAREFNTILLLKLYKIYIYQGKLI